MEIRIQIADSDYEIRNKAERKLNEQLEKLVLEKFQTIDFDKLIEKRIDFLIDRSKYESK